MRKILFLLFLLYFLLYPQLSQAQVCSDKDVLYQYGTIGALMAGNYDSELMLRDLRKHGDFGIGTFSALDGEMLLVGGDFYQVKSDGKIYRPQLDTKSPFATVTRFQNDLAFEVDSELSFQDVQQLISKKIISNYPYAIRIEGEFSYVKTRSVPAQVKPYPPLTEVAKTQPVFEMKNQKGILVGYVLPTYLKDINVPGFHLHYLSADHKSGGHVLDFMSKKLVVSLDKSPQLFLDLPENSDFEKYGLQSDLNEQVKVVEGAKH